MTQAKVARAVGLTEVQLSKSLRGSRQFSAAEVAGLAAELGVSMHWLVTGDEDPMLIQIAARHVFEGFTEGYRAVSAKDDSQLLNDISLLYRQAYGS